MNDVTAEKKALLTSVQDSFPPTLRYDGDGKLVLMYVGGVVTAIAGEHYRTALP